MGHIRKFLFVAGLSIFGVTMSHAAELKVLSAGAVKAGFLEVAAQFEKDTGHKVNVEFMPVGPLLKKLGDGVASDIILMTEEAMAEGRAWIDPATTIEIGRVGKIGRASCRERV